MNLENIEKIPRRIWITIFFLILPLSFSSSFFMFIFNRITFNSLDIWKILLVSMSSTAPLFLLNILLVIIYVSMKDLKREKIGGNKKEFENDDIYTFFIASIMVAIVLYVPVLVRFFSEISLKNAINLSLRIEFGFIVFLILYIIDSGYRIKFNEIKKTKNN